MSKLLVILIYPFTWILVLLAVAFLVKNKKYKHSSFIAALALLVIFSNPFLFNRVAQKWDTPPYNRADTTHYSCAVILGGFSSSDRAGGGYFNFSADRFLQGVKLLLTKKASHILITGGNGNLVPGGFREALWVKKELKEFNFPDSVVLIESNSRNTLENAKFSKKLLEQTHLPPPYLLVTSAYHMPRSLMLFKKMGVDVVPYACNYIARGKRVMISDFIPDAGVISSWNIYIKEMVGYAVNSFTK
ncbi:MAG: YdcF family protein [Mucilaginibacter sp.]